MARSAQRIFRMAVWGFTRWLSGGRSPSLRNSSPKGTLS